MSENGEIYTAGKNFTLPPAVTAWTNSTSAHKYIQHTTHKYTGQHAKKQSTSHKHTKHKTYTHRISGEDN